MVALVLLGAVLRFHRLGEWSFWVDEVFQVRDSLAMDTVGEAVSAYYPLSYLLMRPALVGLGLSEWSARLIPAIIGIIAIPLMYIGAKMVLGRRVAILSVVLLAISPWHLYWSQNARFYTLLLILHNVSLLLFYLGLERDRFRLILFSFVFRVLALMTHPTAILLLPIYVLYFAALKILPFEKPSGLRYRYLIPMTIVPLLLYVAYDGYRIIFADQTSIFLAFVQTFIGYPNLTAFSILGSILYRVGMPLALLALFGGVIMLIKGVRLGLLLGLAAAIPIISVMALSSFTFTAFRYAFVALPGFILLGAYFTIQALRGRTGIWPILIFLGAMVLILSQDHVLEDAGHYLGAGWQFGPLIVFTIFAIIIGGREIWRRTGEGEGFHRERGSGSNLWIAGLLIPVVLQPLLANGLYFTFQYGYRDAWKEVASVLVPQRDDSDLVLSTLPLLADFYLGEGTRHIASVDLDAELDKGSRLLVVEDWGVYKFFGPTEDWLYENCEQTGLFDTFAGGRNFQLRTHLCEK